MVSQSLNLGFGGQSQLPTDATRFPRCERDGFVEIDDCRPPPGHWSFVEDRAQSKSPRRFHPESRMISLSDISPCEPFGGPVDRATVASVEHEFVEITVGNQKARGVERGHFGIPGAVFI